ncbi:MAG: IS630 family transposase [Nitrospirae bacterium]|nr:IS630 family transposase [Nitrospirota bacterium]
MENIPSANRLSAQGQEALRLRAVKGVIEGLSQTEAARLYGVARTTVSRWMRVYRAEGMKGLQAKRRGRKESSKLQGYEAAAIVNLITDRMPEQYKLSYALWTRDAVKDLILKKYRINLSKWTVGRYLRKWGFTPQKPARRAIEQQPEAVKTWLNEKYPTIREEAKQSGGEIHWGDEMGLRSDDQVGRTWGLKGKTPVIEVTGNRFRCNLISTVTNQGTLRFMVFKENFTTDVFIKFLRRLTKSVSRKVFLILDRHSVHKSKKVARWVEKNSDKIQLYLMPGYSPELNPDEYLNNDVKSNAFRKERPSNQIEMKASLHGYLRSTQKQPHIVKNYFCAENVRYAAI